MNVTIDQDGCIGCGVCADTCSAVFKMNEDGVAQVIRQPKEEEFDSVRDAADECPVEVIQIDE
ncbi:MAG TPA: ferredoxin [Treponemataceae bacterium]|nr:ferredoxin [Treponemataceae bacterium]